MTTDENWLDRPAPPLWRDELRDDFPADSDRWSGFDGSEVEGGPMVAYIQDDSGAWRQIGTADGAQFDIVGEIGGLTYATLHTEAPEPEQVSGGSPAYARRDIEWTVTFTFDPWASTPEGDVVERIGDALDDWECRRDAMHWWPVDGEV